MKTRERSVFTLSRPQFNGVVQAEAVRAAEAERWRETSISTDVNARAVLARFEILRAARAQWHG
jgi:hypothetical protein